MKLVDTNIFVHYLSGGPRAGDIEKLLIIHADLVTTLRIVDEAMFVIIRRIALEKLGIRKLQVENREAPTTNTSSQQTHRAG